MVSFSDVAAVIPNLHARQASISSRSSEEVVQVDQSKTRRLPATPYPKKVAFTPTNWVFPSIQDDLGHPAPLKRLRSLFKRHKSGPAETSQAAPSEVPMAGADDSDGEAITQEEALKEGLAVRVDDKFERKYGHSRTGSRQSATIPWTEIHYAGLDIKKEGEREID